MEQDSPPSGDQALCLSEGLPVMTVAHVVCRECLAKYNVGILPYVVRQLNGFLDKSSVGSNAVVNACRQGLSVHMLSYIASRDSTPFWKEGAVSAAEGGHVHVLRWLSDNYTDRCEWGANVMDTAARYGHLQAIQWLHEHREEGCSTDAMDWAICRGDVAMAKWLQANRTEGCTHFAMNYAAFRGHVDTLQWMSENRSEGRPGLAIRAAAQNGHLVVVQWLYPRCDDRYHRLALEDATQSGHLDVVAWLQQQERSEDGLHKVLVEGMKWLRWSLQTPATRTENKNTDTSTKHFTFPK